MTEKTVVKSSSNHQWVLKITPKYELQLKWYRKKRPKELIVVLDRLDTYMCALNECGEPQKVTPGWLHPEPGGVKAITEKGKGGSLIVTRLYIFPQKRQRIVYLLIIGDKNSQKDDIKYCSDFVASLLKA